MSRKSRVAAIIAGSLAAVVLIAAVAAALVLRSAWFSEKVRERIVTEVERATGGRSEVGGFSFDWRRLRVDVRNFVLRGKEGPGKPPLFQAKSIAAGLKIVSILKKDIDIEYVRVEEPQIYVIVYPDGGTNVPEPKVRRQGRPVMERIVGLAAGRFEFEKGIFEVERESKTPFDLRGRNLRAHLGYDVLGSRYQGGVTVQPLEIQWGTRKPLPLDVDLAVSVYGGRIDLTAGRFTTYTSRVDASGSITRLAPFEALFDYQARLSVPDIEPILGVRTPPTGQALVNGKATFAGIGNYSVTGQMHATGIAWRQDEVRLREFRAEGPVSLTPARLEVAPMRVSGLTQIGTRSGAQRVEGRIERVTLRGNDLDAAGVRLAAMGGTFAGRAELRDWQRYHVEGDVEGFEARRLVALYSSQRVPWDGRVSGPVRVDGSVRSKSTVTASVRATITPAESGPPVRGLIDATYAARTGTLDLGRSFLNLPATRVDFSGVLGKQLAVQLESRNPDELLSAADVKSVPVKLDNGAVSFNGTVTGRLEDPLVAGRASLTRFSIDGTHFDALEGDLTASKGNVKLERAALARGTLHAEFEAAAELSDWKLTDSSLIYATGAMRNAPVPDLLSLAGRTDVPATGTVNASVRVTGRYNSPEAAADLTASNGSLYGEPFDRVTAKAKYTAQGLEIASAQIDAGRKQIALSGTYRHAPGSLVPGRLRFNARSNQMPLEEIRHVTAERPDMHGTAQFAAAGEIDIGRTKDGRATFRVLDLSGNAAAGNVAINGQKLGNGTLVAATKGGVLTAYVISDFAGSAIRGDGEFRLVDDYPGTARVTFSRLDFFRLRQFLSASAASRLRVSGSMMGSVTISGPILAPERWKAEANIPQLQVGPAPGLELANAQQDFTLRNAGPVKASMANGVLRIESARFVGRATDLTLAGTVNVQQKSPLDLRLKGSIDLAILEGFNRDVQASGIVTTDATVRGRFDNPQVNGRLEMKNAAFELASFPQGVYNVNGAIAFTGTRATLQGVTAESGGGKVRAAGFVGYEGNEVVFRLFTRAEQVRVRYPEGVSTVANATLNWTGTSDRSTLAGTVSIIRTGFNPQSDFSSILARSAEPVRTPSARSGLLSGTHFDVQIETAPDITFESSLAQDIQAEANLRLRGTGTNPSLLGRINITQGRLVFFGTRYTINQGSVSFFNPARIEPILNVDLETKARGVDVTLTVSGPITKLNLTPRSDPPLQFNEIVALLATGRAPTSDPSLVAAQTANPTNWQQSGASALLGQAIANPVAGRLQRFFGVTRLKIDPSLTGVENNPQARLTLEQQITPNITFTYITNVTNSNPLVVQVEWAINRKWSVLAVREENGLFGIDFLYKKRF